jgi:hypothetical protein
MPVHPTAIRTAQVTQDKVQSVKAEPGVMPGNFGVIQSNIAVDAATDHRIVRRGQFKSTAAIRTFGDQQRCTYHGMFRKKQWGNERCSAGWLQE